MTLRKMGMIRSALKTLGLVVLGIVIGAGGSFGYQFWQEAKTEKLLPAVRRTVLTVSRSVELGEVIEEADLVEMEVEENVIPAGVFTLPEEVIGRKAWVALNPRVMLQPEFFYETNLEFWQNTQEVEVSELPAELLPGDYVDVRILFPSGHDYCVLSHKQAGGLDADKKKIVLGLTEEERVRLGSAQIDVQTYERAYLYLTIYPKAVDMPDTIVRYPVSGSVQPLYEDVAQSAIVGQERNLLEAALIQLKAEEKFLKMQEHTEQEHSIEAKVKQEKDSADSQDKNLESFSEEKLKKVETANPDEESAKQTPEIGKETKHSGAENSAADEEKNF